MSDTAMRITLAVLAVLAVPLIVVQPHFARYYFLYNGPPLRHLKNGYIGRSFEIAETQHRICQKGFTILTLRPIVARSSSCF